MSSKRSIFRPPMSMIRQVPLLLALLFDAAHAACPKLCSGHGICGDGNICSCFEGWDPGAADCSRRTSIFFIYEPYVVTTVLLSILGLCPEGNAWIDKAGAAYEAHREVQCSNAGLCDHVRGVCECFPGFSGNACQRSKRRVLSVYYLVYHSF
jgi:hypothetical protein